MEIPTHLFIYVAMSAILSLLQQTLADSPPIFRKEPSSEYVKRNSRVKLKCKTDPKDADITWVFNGEELLDSEKLGVTVRRGSLVIGAFEDEFHQGDYQCIASNNAGTVISREAYLQVAYIKTFPKTLPDRTHSIAGHVAAIYCQKPESLPQALMEYYFNGKLIEQNDHYKIMPSGSLHILDTSSADEGVYGCRAVNPVTSRTRDQFNATVLQLLDEDAQEEPASISIASGVTAEVHHHALLECVPQGVPYPSVSWQKQGGELPESATQHSGSLKISHVTEEDAGVYECTVENRSGTMVKEVTLEVIELPKISKPPKSVSVGQGGAAQFKCGVTGATEDDITWLHNAQPIPQNNDYYMVQKGSSEVSLIVADVTRTQLGVYQCVVRTNLGMDHASANLKFREGFPQITTKPINTTAIEGENVKLSCLGSGDPSPDVRWTGPGGRSISSRRTMISDDGLTIYNVGPTDEGWYQCTVSNRLGVVSADVYLAVIEKLTVTALPTVRKTIGKPLSSDDGNMTVENTEEPDKPGTVPDSPAKPEIFKTSETSVEVRWDHNESGTSPTTRYTVEYRNIRIDPDWLTASSSVDPSDISYEVRNLSPGGTYRFRVIAANQYGDSAPSEISHRFYLQASTPTVRPVRAPEGEVRIKSSKAVTSSTIEVTWEYTPHQFDSPIDGYYIYHRDTDSDDDRDYIRTPVVGQDQARYRISKLEAEVSYDIKMTSFNSGGTSGFSNVVIVPTPARAQPITVFPNNAVVIPTRILHEQNNGMPNLPDSPDDSPQGGQSRDILYITLGVMLGVILLCVFMFGVMCVWRAKQVNNDQMNRVDRDWRQNGPYYDGSYRYVDTNGSTPHYKYHQVNGDMNGGQPPNHVYTQGIGHMPFGETTTAIDGQPMYPLSQNGITERSLMSSQPVISNGHGPYPASPGGPQKTVPMLPRTRSEPARNGFVPARSREGPLHSGSSSEHLQGNGSLRSHSSCSRHDDGVSSGGESGRSRSKRPKCPHRHHKADVNKAVRRQPNEHPTSREGSIGSSLDCASSIASSSPPPTPTQLAPPTSTLPPPRSDGTDSLQSRSRSSSNLSNASSCRNVKHSDIF